MDMDTKPPPKNRARPAREDEAERENDGRKASQFHEAAHVGVGILEAVSKPIHVEDNYSSLHRVDEIAAVILKVVTVLALWFHTMAGYALARLRFPGRETIFILIFSTFLVSLPVIIVPLFILVRAMGMLNSYAGLIVPSIFNAFGIFLLRQYYLSLPRELEEAAVIDGCGPWRIYWSIMLPLSRPVLAAAAIFSFIWTWDDFFGPLLYLTDVANYTVPLALRGFVDATSRSAWGPLFAMSILSLVPVFAAFLMFQKHIIDGIAASGLKR